MPPAKSSLATPCARSSDVSGKLAGMVLNAVNFSKMEYKYGYYYYRQEDYGYTQNPDDPAAVQRMSQAREDDRPRASVDPR